MTNGIEKACGLHYPLKMFHGATLHELRNNCF